METRTSYDKTSVHARLMELSCHPYDLRATENLFDGQRANYVCHSSAFSLHYWTQRIDDMVLDALQVLADECDLVGQFQAMKRGQVMNCIAGLACENRQVLHTAVRDIFTETPLEGGITAKERQELAKVKSFLQELDEREQPFTTLIHVGIGGSDLGPRSVYEALKAYALPGREVVFISNVDPDDVAEVLRRCDLQRSLVCVVSKSGSTLETRTNELLVRHAFLEAGIAPEHRFVAVTGEGSPMDNPENYMRSFYMFDSIGGRFSTCSMVGMFSLAFCLGYDQIMQFLQGAYRVDKEAEERDIRKNLPLLMALLGIWNHSYLGYPTLAILPYSQGLHRFIAHLQQCDMESNGKSVHRDGSFVTTMTGPIIWGEPGTNGQHAFYQLLHQGQEVVPVEFIGFLQSRYGHDLVVDGTSSQQKLLANLLAQAVAFAVGKEDKNPNRVFAGNRPSSILIGERLTPETMGSLLALYEAKVVFQGFAWNINSFDQEGVQLGKVLAQRFLETLRQERPEVNSFEEHLLQLIGIRQKNKM